MFGVVGLSTEYKNHFTMINYFSCAKMTLANYATEFHRIEVDLMQTLITFCRLH